jgi:hypothetical protein
MPLAPNAIAKWRLLPKKGTILGTTRPLPSAHLLMQWFLPIWPIEFKYLIKILTLEDSWAYEEVFQG